MRFSNTINKMVAIIFNMFKSYRFHSTNFNECWTLTQFKDKNDKETYRSKQKAV